MEALHLSVSPDSSSHRNRMRAQELARISRAAHFFEFCGRGHDSDQLSVSAIRARDSASAGRSPRGTALLRMWAVKPPRPILEGGENGGGGTGDRPTKQRPEQQ